MNGNFQQMTPTDLSRYSSTDVEHVGWYYIPVKNEHFVWIMPYLNKNTNIWMISYVIPVFLGDTTIGVVGMDISFEILQAVVDQSKVYNTGYAFLTNNQAQIVHHRELEMGTSLLEASEGSLDDLVVQLQSKTPPAHLFSYTYYGTPKKMTYQTPNNGLKLVLSAPTAEIDAQSN